MNDLPRHPARDAQLDAALSVLRNERPPEPLRHEAVWAQVEARRLRAVAPPTAVPTRRWLAAATVAALVAGSALLRQFAGPVGTHEANVLGPSRPVLADAARLLEAVATVQPGTVAADTLRTHGALLLASTRALLDAGDHAPAPAAMGVLRDVEYALAQVVQGGLSDPVERDLAAHSIASRRIVERALEGGS